MFPSTVHFKVLSCFENTNRFGKAPHQPIASVVSVPVAGVDHATSETEQSGRNKRRSDLPPLGVKSETRPLPSLGEVSLPTVSTSPKSASALSPSSSNSSLPKHLEPITVTTTGRLIDNSLSHVVRPFMWRHCLLLLIGILIDHACCTLERLVPISPLDSSETSTPPLAIEGREDNRNSPSGKTSPSKLLRPVSTTAHTDQHQQENAFEMSDNDDDLEIESDIEDGEVSGFEQSANYSESGFELDISTGT